MGLKLNVLIVSVLMIPVAMYWAAHQFLGPLFTAGDLGKRVRSGAEEIRPALRLNDHTFKMDDGMLIHHFSTGNGPRHMFVLHGGPGAAPPVGYDGIDLFAKEGSKMGSEYTIHYFHSRGCGKSGKDKALLNGGLDAKRKSFVDNIMTLDKAYGFERILRDIEQFRQAFIQRLDEKVTVYGHSMGGFTAALYAAEFPDSVDALILESPATLLSRGVSEFQDLGLFGMILNRLETSKVPETQALVEPFKEYIKVVTGGFDFSKTEEDMIAFNKEMKDYYFAVYKEMLPDSKYLAKMEAFEKDQHIDVNPVTGWMMQGQFASMGLFRDFRGHIKKNAGKDIPTMVLHGAHDLQTAEQSKAYNGLFLRSEFHELSGSAHVAHDEEPEKVAELIDDFLGKYLKM